MHDSSLRTPLKRHHRAFVRSLGLHHVLRAGARIAAAIGLMVAIGVLIPAGVAGSWVRLALLLLAAVLLLASALRAFARQHRTLDAWLEDAEARFPSIRSWLRNALDLERTPPVHTSADLGSALSAEAARRVREVPLERLRPNVAPLRPLLVVAGSLVLVLALAAGWPERTQRSWRTLLVPASAAPPVRLEVEPGSVTLSPGASLTVRARVWGSTQPPRLWLERGVTPAAVAEGTLVGGGRSWRFDLTQLTLEQDYRVHLGRVASERYHIRFTGEPTPVGFDIEYRAPAYARLPLQRGAASRGDLSALRGTVATVMVTFDRDLERLDVRQAGATQRWEAVTPRRWTGRITIDREGDYELAAVARATGASGGSREGRFRYHIQPLPDAPPVIAVRTPEGDLDLPIGQQVPVEVFAQDDLGLTELRLECRKDPAAPWSLVPLARFGSRPREASVASRWDASGLGLLPGEVATFRFVVFDDNAVSGRGMAVSPTFELRFPSVAEMYERVAERQTGAQTALEKAAQQTDELQRTYERLSRQQNTHAPAESPQSVQRTEELKSAAERQQQIGLQIQDAARELQESIAQAAERKAFDDELMRKLQELNQLMQQVRSEELREAMRRMQEALEKMDRQRMEQALPNLKQQNQEMLANLERSIELLKRLREEERLQSLAQRAQELKEHQDELNRQHGEKPSRDADERRASEQRRAEQQKNAAEASEQLAKDALQSPDSSGRQTPPSEAVQKAADLLQQQAAPQQRQASQSASQGQNQDAKNQGQRASEALEAAAEQLSAAAQQMQEQQSQVDLAAVRRAAQDLVSLQRAAERTLSSDLGQREQSDRQNDLSEGTSRVADSLFTLSQQTPFISNDLAEALGRAINSLQQSGRELATGNRARGEEAGRLGASALNEAVLELRATENAMCNKPGQGKPGRAGAGKIGQLSEQQSQLNQQTRSLSQRLSQQMRMSAGDQGEMQRLAREQARIREQVEQIQKDEEQRRQLLGRLDQAQQEMKDVEEILTTGRDTGELEEKQNRILSRLLDAQRSVNRRDFEPQRESRPGEDVARTSPAPLPADLLRESDRLRLGLLKADADRYPTRYRAFVEAYLRSLNGSRR